jgi:glycine/D-amino acid oxidase-like deaminating enzyme
MVALELARDGQAVRVFDQGKVTGGASSRNAGQTLAGLKPSPYSLIKKYGPARAVELYRATLDAIAGVFPGSTLERDLSCFEPAAIRLRS